MSTQLPAPADAFEQRIWTNPGICSNCFTRCKEITPTGASEWGNKPTEHHDRTPDATIDTEKFDHDRYGALYSTAPRTVCENCGTIRLLADDDTLSKKELHQAATTIAERLEEDGYGVNRRQMRLFINVIKRVPLFNDYDFEILAGAVYYGITHADP